MKSVFRAADILLPAPDTDFETWCALACDQFTSQPAYWQQAEQHVGSAPSTLHLTLPEVYLEQPDVALRIARIHAEMKRCAQTVLTQSLHGFVYVERTTASGVRAGLVGAVDLEAYSYEPNAAPLVRPSENTVVQRIPPRLAVRRGATLETPHIMMLVNDPCHTLLKPLSARKETLRALYNTPLMLDGGHVQGWAITDPADIATIEAWVAQTGTQAAFDAAYPEAAGRAPLALAVGDGNHSLATAKAYWEELKPTLSAEQIAKHPARFALAELVNIHSPAIVIEPIHRAVFATDFSALTDAFCAFLTSQGATLCGSTHPDTQQFTWLAPSGETLLVCVTDAPHPLAVGTLELFLTQYTASHAKIRVDYIHGADALREICAEQGAVGVVLPEFDKSDVFRGVVLGGVLPKKTFSMGESTEKRYYLECRKISL